jgi:hypothetical protein
MAEIDVLLKKRTAKKFWLAEDEEPQAEFNSRKFA